MKTVLLILAGIAIGLWIGVDGLYNVHLPKSTPAYTPKYPKEVYDVQPIIDQLNERKNIDPQ